MADPKLLAALRRGELSGMEGLWERWAPRLRRLCRSMTGDEQQADAATADLFLNLYDEAIGSTFTPDLETWVLARAVAAARRLRPQAPTPRHGDESERADAILATLPVEERLALALCDVQGLGLERAAGLLEEAPSRLEARLQEGRLRFWGAWEATRRRREPNR